MQGSGYLAIWSDLTPQDETDWAHWITREHAAERVGINGFSPAACSARWARR
ncbi:hypothetical protein [Bradyrhizobium sp. sBnM-33]|uniref:hypothetical protein n=1 Tax=Bradyrhizobium sp. sBnM-33 TaxID=2831780 RepID=UPI001BD1983B|nr:hypothetical protein [Bradyrhizobium sp. sBnM-33]WOH48881.1 hypothetical protein RX328_33060 [Bradyrhizobium sp. sBnM-33]